jgi:hypothetical protein
MQALDSFISLIPGFNGDMLIPAVPILTQLPTQLLWRKPGKPQDDHQEGSGLTNLCPRLMLRLLHRVPRMETWSIDRIGILVPKILHYRLFGNSSTAMQSAPRYRLSLPYQKCPHQWSVPKGGEAWKLLNRENHAGASEAIEPKTCTKPCRCQGCPEFSNTCCFDSSCRKYLSKVGVNHLTRCHTQFQDQNWMHAIMCARINFHK